MASEPISISRDEFHRRRAEAEMEMALGAGKLSVALVHLELAKQHRERCIELANNQRLRPPPSLGFFFNGTDKES